MTESLKFGHGTQSPFRAYSFFCPTPGTVHSRGVVTAFKAARLVMERSPHCVLAGEGATKFALANGVEPAEALTDEGRQIFEAWKLQQTNEGPNTNADRGESHDTIGMICLDQDGNLAAGT